jgi:beta-lactamase regulating signal transducer with metallopeptidase domain
MTALIHIAGWTLVSFLWQGALIGVVAAAALRMARRAPASARYAIACAALGAMLATPALTAWWLQSPDRAGRTTVVERDLGAAFVPSKVDVQASPRADRPVRSATRSEPPAYWLPVLVALWLMGVSALTARMVFGWLRVRQLHRASLAMPSSHWQSTASRLAAFLGIGRPVHVAECDLVDAPAVIGWLRPVIVIPVAALASLTPAQADAILAHELAHVQRHDYLVNLAQTVAETLLFYHPAVWWLSGRLRIEREHCCDDVALGVCGDAVEYAEALAAIETRRGVPAFALAAGGGSLVHRIKRILGPTTPASSSIEWVAAPVFAAVLMVGAVSFAQVQPAPPARPSAPVPAPAPAAPAAPASPAQGGSDVSAGREFRMQSKDGLRTREVRGRGALTFSDDLTDVAAMADGAYLTIRDRNWFTVRSIELRGERGGITRKFFIAGAEQPWDPQGRQWLADRLPSLVRRAGLAVESRTRRILSTSGVNGVLDEIKLLETDYVRRLYYRELFRAAPIDAATAARVVTSAGENIRSDFELRQTLEQAVPLVASDATAVRAYVDATGSIGSDFEHRQALAALAKAGALNGAASEHIARSAARIGSDFEKRQVLSELLEMPLVAPERRRAVLEAAATIASDFECATFLIAFAEKQALTGDSSAAFFDVVATIGSDHERGRVLKTVLRRETLTSEVLQGLFQSVRGMQSDFEQAEVLLSVLRAQTIDASARLDFIAAADTIQSDYEQTRVLAALVRAERP